MPTLTIDFDVTDIESLALGRAATGAAVTPKEFLAIYLRRVTDSVMEDFFASLRERIEALWPKLDDQQRVAILTTLSTYEAGLVRPPVEESP